MTQSDNVKKHELKKLATLNLPAYKYLTHLRSKYPYSQYLLVLDQLATILCDQVVDRNDTILDDVYLALSPVLKSWSEIKEKGDN